MSLTRASLQFQTPDPTAGISRSGDTYTLSRGIGNNRTEELDLALQTNGDGSSLHVLRGHRIVESGVGTTTLYTPGTSVYEYAIRCFPTGAADTGFKGNWHGYDNETSLTVHVDGVETAIADAGSASGDSVVVVRVSDLTHPEAVGPLAEVTVTYQMTGAGLDVTSRIVWAQAVENLVAYTAMLPVDTGLSRGKTDGGALVNLTSNDGSVNSSSKSRTARLWQPAGSHGAYLHLHTLDGVHDWGHSDAKDMWLEDNGSRKKAYVGHAKPSAAAGDVWMSRWRIGADYFAAGADATLNF